MSSLQSTLSSFLVAACMAAAVGCGAQPQETAAVQTEAIPLEDFFRNPERTRFKISPEGNYISCMAPRGGIQNIAVRRAGGGEWETVTDVRDRDITDYFWARENTIVFLHDDSGDENYMLFSVALDGGGQQAMLDDEDVSVRIIDLLPGDPEHILIGLNKRDPSIWDVYRLNLNSGQVEMVAENPGQIAGVSYSPIPSGWLADNRGVVRLALERAGKDTNILYRATSEEQLKRIMQVSYKDTFLPISFAEDNSRFYAYSNIGRDRIELVEFDPAAVAEIRTIFSHPDYDAFSDDERDMVGFSQSGDKPSYILHTTWRREVACLDDDAERIFGTLKREVGDDDFSISSRTSAGDKCIVLAQSDVEPGIYYLYDALRDELAEIHRIKPWLDRERLAKSKPLAITARDGLTLHGYLIVPAGAEERNLPVIVWPHGGPQARDAWYYSSNNQFLASRGYAVLLVNFRGSIGYGREFKTAGYKQIGLKMQDDITDAVGWLIEEGIADEHRVAIMGGSYGGYAALAGLAFTPELYACGVAINAPSNLITTWDSFPPHWKHYLEMLHERWGDPVADREQLERTSPALHPEGFRAPVFIAQGENDIRVKKEDTDLLVKALGEHGVEVSYYLQSGEGHTIWNEENTIKFMSEVEKFLGEHMSAERDK